MSTDVLKTMLNTLQVLSYLFPMTTLKDSYQCAYFTDEK